MWRRLDEVVSVFDVLGMLHFMSGLVMFYARSITLVVFYHLSSSSWHCTVVLFYNLLLSFCKHFVESYSFDKYIWKKLGGLSAGKSYDYLWKWISIYYNGWCTFCMCFAYLVLSFILGRQDGQHCISIIIVFFPTLFGLKYQVVEGSRSKFLGWIPEGKLQPQMTLNTNINILIAPTATPP